MSGTLASAIDEIENTPATSVSAARLRATPLPPLSVTRLALTSAGRVSSLSMGASTSSVLPTRTSLVSLIDVTELAVMVSLPSMATNSGRLSAVRSVASTSRLPSRWATPTN